MNITDITPHKEQKTERIKLAPYCRVSSGSEDQLHSFAAQILYYNEYVKRHPQYELVDLYADEGITGTELKKRDELNRLLCDCHKGKIDRIITKSVSRFARNTEDLLVILRMLKELGVSVYFEEQDIDTGKLNMEMIVTFPGMAAQQESEAISGNLRWSFQKRMQAGEYNCTYPPYGYKRENGELIIFEQEARVVRRIFEMYLDGKGTQTIAAVLNEESVPRRNGHSIWYPPAVNYILTNERYMGDALLQKYYMTAFPYRQKRNKGEKPQYYVENSHTPIISKEMFLKAQKLLKRRKFNNCQRTEHPLLGRMKCPECGGLFRRQKLENMVYWLCMNFSTGKSNCKSRRVREDMVYETFIDMVYKLKANLQKLLGTTIHQMEILQTRVSHGDDQVLQIDKNLADLNAKNLVVTKLHTNGILSASEYSLQTAELSNAIGKLRLERRKKLSEKRDTCCGDLKELYGIMESYQPNSVFDKALFELIVEEITVEDSSQITFRLLGGLSLTEEIEEKGRCKSK